MEAYIYKRYCIDFLGARDLTGLVLPTESPDRDRAQGRRLCGADPPPQAENPVAQ